MRRTLNLPARRLLGRLGATLVVLGLLAQLWLGGLPLAAVADHADDSLAWQ